MSVSDLAPRNLVRASGEMTSAAVSATLRNDGLPPLRRLRAWIDGQLEYLRKEDMRRGCLYGNLNAEASEESDRTPTITPGARMP